jgi:hypothetical protein
MFNIVNIILFWNKKCQKATGWEDKDAIRNNCKKLKCSRSSEPKCYHT